MKVEFLPAFIAKLDHQVERIARDKPGAARAFKKDMIQACKSLADFPYRCRPSIHYDDETIRDLVFKGYTVIYKIDGDRIRVFALTKHEDYGNEINP